LKASISADVSRDLGRDGLATRAYLNALASGLDYGARVFVGFVVNPFLVAGLGPYLFGVWQLLSRTVGYVSATSGRTPQALKWTIASHQVSADYEEKRRQVGSAIAVWAVFLPVVVLAGLAVGWMLPWLLGTPLEVTGTVRVAIGLLIANLAMVSLADIPRSVLGGENLGYKRMGLSTVLILVGGGLTVAALYLGTGLPGVAAAQLATTVLSGAVFLRVARQYVQWFGVAWPSLAGGRRFLGLSSWFVVWRLIMQVMLAGDIVVLGFLGRVELVTAYVLSKYAAETMVGFAAMIMGGIAPGLGGIIGAGRLVKAAAVRNEMLAATWLMTTTVGTTVVLWDREFVRLWVGAAHYAGLAETVFIVLMLTQFVFIRSDAQVIDLTLNVRRKVLLGGVSAVASLVLAGTFVRVFDGGIAGVCLGLMLGRLALTLAYPGLVGRLLGVPLRAQLRSAARPVAVTALVLATALALEPLGIARGWPQLLLAVPATAATVAAVALYAGLPGDVRRRLVGRFRHAAMRAEAAH
jgi:hypothetical protein